MNNSNNQSETYIDNSGQVRRRVPGSPVQRSGRASAPGQVDYRQHNGGGGIELDETSRRMLTIAVVAMLLMGLASLGGGEKSVREGRGSERETTAERILAAEESDREGQRGNDGSIAGSKGVISGELERSPGSPYPYKIRYAGRDIPIELHNGDQYLGKWVNLWVEYTGEGERFVIKRVNIVE